ncbi:hypothetical protein [Pseudoclavibacter sp. RFBG4]|uniref:hypothetical protein n=1 Tax=Pseudoclavibacter sp. RFBG4 TaxID=2080575 RepID=UPI0011B032D4|nr:hypothetical protein [Pseudoclavibacter sp. RFBG4]
MTMRTRELLREAFRNTRSRTSLPVAQFVSLLLVVGLLGALDGLSVANAVGAYRAFIASGATVATATGEGSFDGRECEIISDLDSVRISGAAREHGTVTFDLMPSNPVPLWEVTPGFARLLTGDVTVPTSGLLLAEQVAESIGRGPGDTVGVSGGAASIGARYQYPDDGRIPGFGWAVLSIVPAVGEFDQCWVDIPSSEPSLALLPLAAGKAGKSADVSVAQLNSTLGGHFDLEVRLEERPTRIAPWLSLLLAGIVSLVVVRLRRVQMASVLHVGVSRPALLLQTLIETVIVTTPAACLLSVGCVLFASHADLLEPWVLLGPLLKVVTGAFDGSMLGALLGAFVVNERVLYRSFRDRA